MRWSLCLSAAIMVIIPTFSTPIPRMLLRKRGLFTQTLELTNTTPDVLAAMVTNALTSDPRPCDHVKSFFEQLAQGESDGGITTIGDRAVAGARKMLNLQSAGNAGLVQMVNELQEGTLSNQSTTALIQALSNSARTIASLKTYKFLLDTQAALNNLTTGINSLNGTGLKPLMSLVQQIQPILLKLEDTIDNFGAAFSVQDVANQASDIQNILSLVEDSNGNVQKLKGLNKENQQAVNQLIDAAQDPMDKLAAAASEAGAIANQPPVIPPEQFNGVRGTACTANGANGTSNSTSAGSSAGSGTKAGSGSGASNSASASASVVAVASSVVSSVAESASVTASVAASASAVSSAVKSTKTASTSTTANNTSTKNNTSSGKGTNNTKGSSSTRSGTESGGGAGGRSFHRRPKPNRLGTRPSGSASGVGQSGR